MPFPDTVDDKLTVDGLHLRTVRDYILEAVNTAKIHLNGDVRINGFIIEDVTANYTDEQVRDVIGTALISGAGISIAVNDAGDIITITNTAPAGTQGPAGDWSTPIAFTAVAGTAYTPVLSDAGKFIETSNAGSVTVTIPANASVAYPVGSQLHFIRYGAGGLTIVGDTGVTVRATPSAVLRAQYSQATITKRATNEWLLAGDLA